MSVRLFRVHDRCVDCQVGQGRQCRCREAKLLRRLRLTTTEWVWVLIAFDAVCLWGAVRLLVAAWGAWA